ncbi:substrate-binding domain-containing protein [Flavobacterium sp.]|jgi:ABC-type nitrate/sulfonate/bicarbonate transport system substrate-binding protein|uniref:substrate-binding domain-containing protein n=1 Tax=Flavobacterium sp. TaxID=239 RepID=UPI0037BF7709
MKSLKIAGVPEHFNLPWQLAIENNKFHEVGIDLQWTDVPEGTGKLCQMLRDGSTDIAVILTEGIIKDIVNGNNSKIIQIYVESPLIWGIHVGADSKYSTLSDLENTKVAISRFGSGSELMAYVNADQQGWDKNSLTFEVVNTIDGAVTALTNGIADYFMWEHFMTKPLVDKGIFRRVGDCPTPWPSFVIAVQEDVLQENPDEIKKLLISINKQTKVFKSIPNIDAILASKFQQKIEDIQQWLKLTEWSQNNLSEEMTKTIQNQLFELQIINKKATYINLVKAL